MKITTYDLEDFSPCKSCTTCECGLVDGKAEYALAYGQNNKGYATYTITQRFE